MMLRGSLTSDKNETGVAGRYPGAHTLLMSGGDERFHRKNGLKRKKIRDPGEKALARGVALLGVKVTGIEPPRLTFVTVYRLPIRRPAKSALTWPVV